MIHSIWMLRSECAHFHGSMVDKCCTSQKINGLQSSFGRGTINPEIHICNMFRPYSVSHSPSQWRYRQSSLLRMSRISHVLRGLASQVQRRAICCASPRRQCQIMSDLFLDAHRDFGGSWGRMIINTTLNWFPNGRSARSKLPICKYVLSWGLLLEEWLGGYLCKKWSDIPNTPHLKTLENELPWKRAMW